MKVLRAATLRYRIEPKLKLSGMIERNDASTGNCGTGIKKNAECHSDPLLLLKGLAYVGLSLLYQC